MYKNRKTRTEIVDKQDVGLEGMEESLRNEHGSEAIVARRSSDTIRSHILDDRNFNNLCRKLSTE